MPPVRDEYLCLTNLSGAPIHYLCRLTGIVYEQLFAGTVFLTHHHIKLSGPGAVLITEPAVLKALGMDGFVLVPQQRERHTLATQLPMDIRPIRTRSFSSP